jgi:DNA-binding response OmpR family regulator
VVEDDHLISNSLRHVLTRRGATVAVAATLHEASVLVESGVAWDLVLLDLRLPDGDGLSLLEAMQRSGERTAGVIAISGNFQDAKRSLRVQAHRAVLLPKPFEADDLYTAIDEAMILVNRAARHSSQPPALASAVIEGSRLSFGPVAIDLLTQAVSVDGQPVELPPVQFRLLAQLLASPGRALSVAELVETALRGFHGDGSTNIRFQIHGLRRKLGSAGGLIETVPGGGYRVAGASEDDVESDRERGD